MLWTLVLVALCGLLIAAFGYPRAVTVSIVVAATGVMLLAEQGREQFTRLATYESGPLELATFLGFLLAAGGFGAAFLGGSAATGRRWLLGLAVICAALAGEEASWGQHFFKFRSPGMVAEINIQGELNLHNVFSSQLNNLIFLVGLMLVFIVTPVAVVYPSRTALALRGVLSFALLLVLIHLVQGPLAREHRWEFEPFRPVFWTSVAAIILAVTLLAGRLVELPPVVRLRESFARAVVVPPSLLGCALTLFGLWLVYGLRFGSLWDLRLFQTGFLITTDDEMIEFLGALLFVMFAGFQLGHRLPGVGWFRRTAVR